MEFHHIVNIRFLSHTYFTAGVRNGLVIQFWLIKGYYYRDDNYPLYVVFICTSREATTPEAREASLRHGRDSLDK